MTDWFDIQTHADLDLLRKKLRDGTIEGDETELLARLLDDLNGILFLMLREAWWEARCYGLGPVEKEWLARMAETAQHASEHGWPWWKKE